MFKRRDRGRLLRTAIWLAIPAALLVAGSAFAVSQTIVGQADNTFSAPTYTSDQGDVATLQVTGSNHNATASAQGPDNKALFRSATITGGTTPVNGTQYLTTGSYQFICTIHPSTMVATLVVSNKGTPQARPQATLAVTRRSISRVVKSGLLVQVTANAKIDGFSLEAKLGSTSLAKATGLSVGPGNSSQVLRLTKAGKSKLRKLGKANVTVTGDVPFGTPATTKAKLK